MRKYLSCLLSAIALLLSARTPQAQVTSNFTTGPDGWTTLGNSGIAVDWQSSGGNPAGFISTTDLTSDWAYLQAPAKFLKPAKYGGQLSFDVKTFNSDPAQYPTVYNVRVALVGGGLTLINESTLPTTAYKRHAFPLSEKAGWRLFGNLSQNYSTNAPAPTAAEMQNVLANLTGVFIAADYSNGAQNDNGAIDRTSIDNVALVPAPAQLANISTRVRVGTDDDALIGGFIVTGTKPKKVIIRAIGPTLESQVSDTVLADPTLELFDAAQHSLAFNNNWKDTQRAAIEATGIPPGDNFESAIVRTLPPGNYTAIVRGNGGATGVGLVEVYDLALGVPAKLANISSRGPVGTGENVLIGGFIVGAPGGGAGSARVVVRAIGPSLENAGVDGVLENPTLQLVNADGTIVRANDDWKDGQREELETIGIQPSDDRESALIETLSAGGYTAVVRGSGDTTGVGLVEVYHIQ